MKVNKIETQLSKNIDKCRTYDWLVDNYELSMYIFLTLCKFTLEIK